MTHYPTCQGCAVYRKECPTLAGLRKAMKGLRVTTIRHKCESYVSMFPPGAPVLIETYSRDEVDPHDGPTFRKFPGHVVQWERGKKALCFIKPGTPSENEESVVFVPKVGKDGNDNAGWVKVSPRRLTPIPGALEVPCPDCQSFPSASITGVCGAIVPYQKARCKHVDHFKFLGGEIALHGSEWAGTEHDDIPF